jgi:hypothetical protein
MTTKEFSEWVNGCKNVILLGCIICAYVFAFTAPFKSIAFTLLGALLGLMDMKIRD